tara:strand:- start:1 stop:141 length:141 start_codon:yes stop_codon:yes gene_type:complete
MGKGHVRRDSAPPTSEELLYAVLGLLAILAVVLVAATPHGDAGSGR